MGSKRKKPDERARLVGNALADVLVEERGLKLRLPLQRACWAAATEYMREDESGASGGEELVAARLYVEHEEDVLRLVDLFAARQAEESQRQEEKRQVRRAEKAARDARSPYVFLSANRRR